MPIIQIATDGSCIQPGGWRDGDPRPRPGAAAFILERRDGSLVRFAVPEADTTIGRMEMTALAAALEHVLAQPAEPGLSYQILCDSQFVVNGYNDWLAGWAAKNFTKKGGLANADVWQRIHATKSRLANAGIGVVVSWVKGHNGNRMNHLVDELANTCARTQIAVDDTGHPPSLTATKNIPATSIDDAAFGASPDESTGAEVVDAAREAWIDHLTTQGHCDDDRAAYIRDGREDANTFILGYLAGTAAHA